MAVKTVGALSAAEWAVVGRWVTGRRVASVVRAAEHRGAAEASGAVGKVEVATGWVALAAAGGATVGEVVFAAIGLVSKAPSLGGWVAVQAVVQ